MYNPVVHSPAVDVLIAEDDPKLRDVLRALLEQKGYRCTVAASGREAVACARQSPPRLALLDLTKPGSDSLFVARQLRADPQTRHTHIHCLSARSDAAARRQARQAGCESFLTKPLDADTLLKVVQEQVQLPEESRRTGLTLRQAEELLDWLEANGCTGAELTIEEGGKGFTVRWSETP
jgi:CheY-like chemotaxis protein